MRRFAAADLAAAPPGMTSRLAARKLGAFSEAQLRVPPPASKVDSYPKPGGLPIMVSIATLRGGGDPTGNGVVTDGVLRGLLIGVVAGWMAVPLYIRHADNNERLQHNRRKRWRFGPGSLGTDCNGGLLVEVSALIAVGVTFVRRAQLSGESSSAGAQRAYHSSRREGITRGLVAGATPTRRKR